MSDCSSAKRHYERCSQELLRLIQRIRALPEEERHQRPVGSKYFPSLRLAAGRLVDALRNYHIGVAEQLFDAQVTERDRDESHLQILWTLWEKEQSACEHADNSTLPGTRALTHDENEALTASRERQPSPEHAGRLMPVRLNDCTPEELLVLDEFVWAKEASVRERPETSFIWSLQFEHDSAQIGERANELEDAIYRIDAALEDAGEENGTELGDSAKGKVQAGEEDEDALPAKKRKLAPSRIKAKAAYEWAISKIPGAEDMTLAELYDAIECHPSRASEAIGPSAATFGKYIRDAGIKRYATKGSNTGRSIRRSSEL